MSLAAKKLLVTGSGGMLAADLVPVLEQAGARLTLTDHAPGHRGAYSGYSGYSWEKLDISNSLEVDEVVSRANPDWIVNCAAYTKVDDAEKQIANAFSVNSSGPCYLAEAAARGSARMLHISSDYVFGSDISSGDRRKPFTETETARPCGVYGWSKHFGDEFVRAHIPTTHVIVRTSWLHGVSGPNFIDTMLRLSTEREELRVVNDQFGSPTWTGWLAEVIRDLISKESRGTFHASSRGDITWLDFATEVFRQAGRTTRVMPQTTVELNRPAPRPAYSTLDVTKLEAELGRACPTWQEDIASHLQQANR